MKKLCGVVLAAVLTLGLTAGPAAAAQTVEGTASPRLICWLLPKLC